jgi:hypothetical protein
MTTFQEHFAQNLQAFGWSVDAADLPEAEAVNVQLHAISDWWHSLGEETQAILRPVDLSEGLRQAGKLGNWPGFYDLLAGQPFENFDATANNVIDCYVRARNAVGEDAIATA